MIVGATFWESEPGQADEGAAFVYYGGAGGLVTTSSDVIQSDEADAQMGFSAQSAGDVNGDGYGDILIGDPIYENVEDDEGGAFVFLGSPGGPAITPQQLSGDGSGTPVEPGGVSNAADAFQVRMVATRRGRANERGKLEVETCPIGVGLGDASCVLQQSPTWVALSPAPTLTETVAGLDPGALYRWRARVLYAPFHVTEPGIAPAPGPPAGPWRRLQAQATEGDVRTLPEPGPLAPVAAALAIAYLARRRDRASRPSSPSSTRAMGSARGRYDALQAWMTRVCGCFSIPPAAIRVPPEARDWTHPWAQMLLYGNLSANAALLMGAVWCIAFPSRRIDPMARRNFWYFGMWTLFGFIFLSNPAFVVLDWSTGMWTSALRFWLAGPLIFLGGAFVLWGMATLGARRTSGLPEGVVAEGPYLLTRNPQYVGDFLLFSGVAVLANSEVVAVTHLLTALVLLVAPLAEEPWLESEYGEPYTAYRKSVPRYL